MTAASAPRSGPLALVAHLVAQVVAIGRDLATSLGRDFIWQSIQDGRIRTRGLPAGVRVAVLAACAVVVGLLASIVFADSWRSFDPTVLSNGQVLRGTLIPAPLVPVTFAILAFGAALCVSGALRSGPLVAAGVGAIYAVVAAFVHGFNTGSGTLHRAAGWAILGVLLLLVVVRHLPVHPVLELLAVVGLVGFTFVDAHRFLAATDRASGTGFLGGQTDILLSDVLFLSTPLVIAAALEVVAFGTATARWGLEFVDRQVGRHTVLVAAIGLGAWRLRDLGLEWFSEVGVEGWPTKLQGLVGSLVLLNGIVAVAALLTRLADDDLAHEDPEASAEASARLALPIALALTAITAVSAVLLLVLQGLLPILPFDRTVQAQRWLSSAIGSAGDFGASLWWTILRATAAMAVAVVLARRGRGPAAVFLGAIAVVLVHAALTDPGQVLEAWAWRLDGVDLIAVTTLAGLFGWWAVRRRLSSRRCEWALYLLLLSGLLRQGSFVSDPIAPLLAFSGVAFVLVGLIWGFATGLSWANESSPQLPRPSRAQLLLGYQVLSISILHWYVVSHDLDALDNLTSVQPGAGTALLGQPLLLVLIVTALASAWTDVAMRGTADAVEPDAGG